MLRRGLAGFLFLLLVGAGVRGEGDSIEAYRDTAERLIEAALTEGEAYGNLRGLCEAAPRRLAGSPGAAAAVEWARQAMVRDGLENVRLQPCTVPHWERGDLEEVRLLSPPEAAGERLAALALGGSVPTPEGGIQAEVLEVKSLEELAGIGEVARGKIIFFNRPMDPSLQDPFQAYGKAVDQRVRGAAAAAKVGGVAAIVRSMTLRLDDVPHTGGMRYEDGVPKVPTAAISTRAAERLSSLLKGGRGVSLHLRFDCRTLPDKPSFNVIGELRGSELPDEIVLIGAHLDAWDVGQGAHDCGAGSVQVIEAVRLLRALKLRPRRTIRVVLFMNEEFGLSGARAYRASVEGEALTKHLFALESDRGGFAPRGFSTDANDEALATLSEIASLVSGIGAGKVWKGWGGADIGPLAEGGVVTAGYVPEAHRYFDVHHAPTDTIDRVNPRELQLGAAAIAVLSYVVADMETPLKRN